MAHASPNLRCCLFCGRDTTARCQICARCFGENRRVGRRRQWDDSAVQPVGTRSKMRVVAIW